MSSVVHPLAMTSDYLILDLQKMGRTFEDMLRYL